MKALSFIAKVIISIVVAPITAAKMYCGMIKDQFNDSIAFGLFSSTIIVGASIIIAPVVVFIFFGVGFGLNLDNLLS